MRLHWAASSGENRRPPRETPDRQLPLLPLGGAVGEHERLGSGRAAHRKPFELDIEGELATALGKRQLAYDFVGQSDPH
jgi:hypothetical protein